MKTLFIHLSDIHINKYRVASLSTETVFNSLKNDIDESNLIFLLFTGDMSNSGLSSDLSLFSDFFDSIIKKINDYKDDIVVLPLVIPGNHDIKLLGDNHYSYDVKAISSYNEQRLDQIINEADKYMIDSINLCRKYGTFINNNYVDYYKYETQNIIYSFVAINSSPFSALKKVDKEHHYIPSNLRPFALDDLSFGKKNHTHFLVSS